MLGCTVHHTLVPRSLKYFSETEYDRRKLHSKIWHSPISRSESHCDLSRPDPEPAQRHPGLTARARKYGSPDHACSLAFPFPPSSVTICRNFERGQYIRNRDPQDVAPPARYNNIGKLQLHLRRWGFRPPLKPPSLRSFGLRYHRPHRHPA